MMTKEEKFYRALADIFVGVPVEGESGYINLMKIKSRYYQNGVFPRLQKDIEEALKPFPEFKDELFDKLYTFFSRYFSESGSIYFNYTPIHQNIYEKVYTDDRDVILFWKTHMLYYVKTDRLFRNLETEIDGFKFSFDVSTIEHKKANEKRDIIYDFKGKKDDGTLICSVHYTEKGRKTRAEDILKTLSKQGVKINEDILERAFRVFEKQSQVDYFINKNAGEFLKEQFNIWLYQYVFSGESEWTENRIKQLQTLKDFAYKVIDFISQFEDELVRIWNKPKFVLNSNYVITLDRIADKNIELLAKVIDHPGFNDQITEWKQLGIVNDDFTPSAILSPSPIILNPSPAILNPAPVILSGSEESSTLNPKYSHLPIDTKHFKELELEIIGLFDDLDNALDGWLIKSENYQALNTILPKFKEKVQTIYIDPPFNKEQDADYFYSVKYKNSSWITLLENRLPLAKDILKDTGSIFVRCDYNGNMYVRMLMNEIFGEENFRNEMILKRSGIPQSFMYLRFNPSTDTLFLYAKSGSSHIIPITTPRDRSKLTWIPMHIHKENRYRNEIAINGEKFVAPKSRHFPSQELVDKLLKENRIKIAEKEYVDVYGNKQTKIPYYLPKEFDIVDSDWTNVPSYSQTQGFPTENSEILLKRVIESTSNKGDLVMDYFLGSGTTTAVAHKLGRKWLGVEMGEHFSTVVLPRMKKVLAGEKSGISKEVKQQGGGFFKYYELEQYEDTLRKVKYEDSDLFENPYEDPYHQYVFMRDLKMLEAMEIDYESNKVKVDLSKFYPDPSLLLRTSIDIPETLSNLLGRRIKRITADEVEFENGEKINIKDLDYKLIKPLIWW